MSRQHCGSTTSLRKVDQSNYFCVFMRRSSGLVNFDDVYEHENEDQNQDSTDVVSLFPSVVAMYKVEFDKDHIKCKA